MNTLIDLSIAVVSIVAAAFSVHYARKSYGNFKYGHMPVLIPTILEVGNPKLVKIKITNQGNGLAQSIKAYWLNQETDFDTDLLPAKYGLYHIEFQFDATFEEGDASKNELFKNPLFTLVYTDMFGKELKTISKFKPDVVGERRQVGHIDKNFTGHKFVGYS